MSEGYGIERHKAECFQSAFLARSAETVAKHRARAIEQLAAHRCATDLTDGFCGPRDGNCQRASALLGSDHRNCMILAEGLMQAIESRGCTVVWAYDPVVKP
jgi:hypothetical protein